MSHYKEHRAPGNGISIGTPWQWRRKIKLITSGLGNMEGVLKQWLVVAFGGLLF